MRSTQGIRNRKKAVWHADGRKSRIGPSPRPTHALRNAMVIVRENRHGGIAIEYKGKALTYSMYREQAKQAEVVASK